MYEIELTVAKDIAYKAGVIMRQYFDADQARTIKEDGTPLTIADTTINSMVIAELQRQFPEDGVIGEEESTVEYGIGRRWICDPIDGTKAFTWGVPTAMFSLALVVDGVPQVGVCYEPMLDKMYWATEGGGAYRNGTKLTVNQEDLETGILGTISSSYRIRCAAPYMQKILDRRIQTAVFSGAVAKCIRVAEGRFVGYIEELANPHDVAASHIITEEAGGMITTLDGSRLDYKRPFQGVIVSNGKTHKQLVDIVKTNE